MQEKRQGIVYLIGAGPGDVRLLTRSACDAIAHADVIFYDSLIGTGIKGLFPEHADCICVGKRSGAHSVPQSRINSLLIQAAKEGKRIARIKGGDPFLFGRGGEEMLALASEGILYEVVPGIPSPIGVPAYFGMPVTHRKLSASVHLYTGHREEGEAAGLDFSRIARTEGTHIFLMGVKAAEVICSSLIGSGMSKETPAAFLQEGTTAAQRAVVSDLEHIAKEGKKQGVHAPAILVIGEVCSFLKRRGWREQQALSGSRLILTGISERIAGLGERFSKDGAEIILLPTIRTEALLPNEELDHFVLSSYDWIVFTSPSGIRIFFEEMRRRKTDHRSFAQIQFACMGGGSAAALEAEGFHADLIPEQSNAEALGVELARRLKEDKQEEARILIPRAQNGNPALLKGLSGYSLTELITYRTVARDVSHFSLEELKDRNKEVHAVFTSASSVHAFARGFCLTEDTPFLHAYCIGEQTAKAAGMYGAHVYTAKEASYESLASLVYEVQAGIRQKNEGGDTRWI